MNPKISVIVPIYNVEDFLEDTLNCLLNQTIINDMEVLMIDDGSTDDSRYIIEKYALDYDNFHAFHKINEGSSFARNYGLNFAKGEYIHFLDGDDYIGPDAYERLYKIAIENNSDIVTAPLVRYKRYNILDGTFYKNSLKKIDRDISSTRFEDNPELIWDLFITNKLYKHEFLTSNGLKLFELNRAYCDDVPFSLKTYLLADKISISKETFYYWRIRENEHHSQTQTIINADNFFDRVHSFKMCNEIIKECGNDIRDRFYAKILDYDLYIYLSRFYLFDEKYHSEIIDELNNVLEVIKYDLKNHLTPVKIILYEMVENRDMDSLCKFTQSLTNLKENPDVSESLDSQYVKYLDFEKEAESENLVVKQKNIYLKDDDLIIEFSEGIRYLDDDYPHKSYAVLIDNEGDEHNLDVRDKNIIIPLNLILDKSHMKIRMSYVASGFTKESYLTNSKREALSLNGHDIDIGVGENRTLFIDIRPTNDLEIKINDVALDEGVLEFKGTSCEEIERIYIQNVIDFRKIFYPVSSIQNDDEYEISFSIPHGDILSFAVRKWELYAECTFKTISLNKNYSFYMNHNYVYIINARNKVLISDDIYNSSKTLQEYYDRINKLKKSNKYLKDIVNKKSKEDTKPNNDLKDIDNGKPNILKRLLNKIFG